MISFGWQFRQESDFLSGFCLSCNTRSNWLTNTSLGFYVRSLGCQLSYIAAFDLSGLNLGVRVTEID